jgi:hypothetical protein
MYCGEERQRQRNTDATQLIMMLQGQQEQQLPS